MKLQILPAKQGLLWVRLGIRTFWRQPLAMTGQFFLFMGLLSLCSLIPFIGSFVGLALLPMASLGLMAATREAHVGNFPMPHLLWLGLRSGAETRRHMAVLGGLYAVGFCAVLALAALSDGGQFAKLYLFGGSMDIETLMQTLAFYFYSLLKELPKSFRYLEIGSYEGNSALYVSNNFPKGHVTCVDFWEAVGEYEGNDFSVIEKNFDSNIRGLPNVNKIKDTSDNFFTQNQTMFDFIYIDGNHKFDYVLRDCSNAIS